MSSGAPTRYVLVPSAFSDIHSLDGEALRLLVEVYDDISSHGIRVTMHARTKRCVRWSKPVA
jgi:hypothetical protein